MYTIKEVSEATREIEFTNEENAKVLYFTKAYECSIIEAIELILETR